VQLEKCRSVPSSHAKPHNSIRCLVYTPVAWFAQPACLHRSSTDKPLAAANVAPVRRVECVVKGFLADLHLERFNHLCQSIYPPVGGAKGLGISSRLGQGSTLDPAHGCRPQPPPLSQRDNKMLPLPVSIVSAHKYKTKASTPPAAKILIPTF